MRRIPEDGGAELPPDNPFPDPPDTDTPPPDPGDVSTRTAEMIEARDRWVEALTYWQTANVEAAAQHFANAEVAYEISQRAVIGYFQKFYTNSPLQLRFNFAPGASTAEKLGVVVNELFDKKGNLPELWAKVRRRREAITLEELQKPDWGGWSSAAEFLLTQMAETETNDQSKLRQRSLDYFALILATVFIPLARAEMNRLRRNFNAAIEDYERLLTPYRKPASGSPLIWLTCDFIERPFILLALGETRMETAEVQFKAASQGQADEARATYQSIPELFKDHGAYVSRVASAQNTLTDNLNQLPQLPPDRKDMALQVFGKDVTVPGIESATKELPGLSQTKAPAESWLRFKETVNGEVIAETNPRIYALLLNAQARLLQIENGFNYLGYKDDYIPPWRFQFLLERARYFSEHAKNAQRDYLNFVSNAEREEFQEQSAAQAVEMEKANVAIESKRQEQAGLEVAAARQSTALAEQTAVDSIMRLDNYKEFDRYADSLFGTMGPDPLELLSEVANMLPGLNAALTGVGDFFTGGAISNRKQTLLADAQRGVELFNLRLARVEAFRAAAVARAQQAVAQAGLIVTSLQRQAALLRHEFAIQNLRYLRNRTLNAEQWFRLANAIRSVADTYLRYAVELAFLTEQAYEFEADKRINVIRFDYDQSEVGDFLAGDFLLSDLDTVEQDFVVNQRQRQQQVRYVLSMAREFPAALEELRETGKVNFVLRLEQIEKRFPGLYNARIGMVDVLPLALLDSTRFSFDLTHLGSGQLRIKG